MSPNLNKLRNRLAYRCDGSEDYVRCIRAIARTRDLDAIRVLARLLDMSGPAARAAMDALVGFGEAALPEVRRRHVRRTDRVRRSDMKRSETDRSNDTSETSEASETSDTSQTSETKARTTMTMNKTLSMIHHPQVVRPIQTTLRSFGVRKQDLEDGVAEVQTRTLEYLRDKPLPTELEQWVALCVTITRSWRLDEKKKAKTAKKYCEGLCEDPDERIGIEAEAGGRDLLDARRILMELRKMFDAGEMPEKGEEILDCMQAGMKQTEIAAELGITSEAVRMRLRKIREIFEERLAQLGITGVLFVLVMLASGPAMAANQAVPTAPPASVPVPPPRVQGAE